MNRRRQLLTAIGLGSVFAGVTAVVPREALAATEKPRPTFPLTPPVQRPEYEAFSVPASGSVEDVFDLFNAAASKGFRYAGFAQRDGHTEYIFVKWLPVRPITPDIALKPGLIAR
jgi:hypothetical protein